MGSGHLCFPAFRASLRCPRQICGTRRQPFTHRSSISACVPMAIRSPPPPSSPRTASLPTEQRFEHNSADKSAARKIEASVRFPASLNMAPYTTLVMHKQEQMKEGGSASMSLVPYVSSRFSFSLTSPTCLSHRRAPHCSVHRPLPAPFITFSTPTFLWLPVPVFPVSRGFAAASLRPIPTLSMPAH